MNKKRAYIIQYCVTSKRGTIGHIYASNIKQAKAIATKYSLKRSSVKRC